MERPPPPGSSSPPAYNKTTSSSSQGLPHPRGLNAAIAANGAKVTNAARSETSGANVIMSGTHVTAVLTWAAAAGMQLPAEWLSWYTAFVCRVLQAPSSSRQPPSSLRAQADPQASSQAATLLLSASRWTPSSSSRPNNERGAFSVAMRPRDHLAILEALAVLHERGLLPRQQPPPQPLPQHQAACLPCANPDVSKPSAPTSPAAEVDLGGAQAAASAAVKKVQPLQRTAADGDCGMARLVTRALVPAAANAARRQLANGPLVARTCAALARLTGGGGSGGNSSRAQVSLLPPPGRRYVAAVEAATRWHMPTLSVAEVASTAEALTTWCGLQQRQQQEGLTGHGGGAGREVAPPPLGGRGSSKPASLVVSQGDDSEQQFTLLPAAWSASAVVHTRRAAVLRACLDASELLALAAGFRNLGCRAPPLWFEAVLEEALWRCGQWEQLQHQQRRRSFQEPKEQQEEARREGSSAGRPGGSADGSLVGIENHRSSGTGGGSEQHLLISKGWSSSMAQSSHGGSGCDNVVDHQVRGSGVPVDGAAAFMTAAQLAELRRLLRSVPGAEDAMRLLALGRPDLLEPS